MKRTYVLVIVGLLLVLTITFLRPTQLAAQDREAMPTLIPLKIQTPAPTPPDQREVAILTLVVKSDREGKLESIGLEKGVILRSYAPNVLDRTGTWTVVLAGEEKFVYGILDPRWREAYPQKEGELFQSEYATEVVWELVVPLYLFDKDLNVETITIFDETGTRIFTTEVDREKWK